MMYLNKTIQTRINKQNNEFKELYNHKIISKFTDIGFAFVGLMLGICAFIYLLQKAGL